ncbi:MAG: hypothetical protein K5917_03580 [Clostridiales bacterium]|nr:hypothetical protein [Clostridiales bacterium]
MSKAVKISLYSIVLIFVLACILYAVGIFDKFFLKKADSKYYENGDFYFSGDLLDGKFYGKGEIKINDNTFIGKFTSGKIDGAFVLESSDGVTLSGSFNNNSITEGTLTANNYKALINGSQTEYTNNSGFTYVGGFDSTGMHGEGTLTYKDGSKYVGQFTHGFADKSGTYYAADGTTIIYQGEFKNGLFDGYGKYSFNNVQYVGNFKEGLPEGTGIYTAKDGSTYEGTFVKGKLNGDVNITNSSGKKSVGKWENGKRVS